jgi:predicted helicase
MQLSSDRTALWINPSLTLRDIPPAVFDYQVGDRSALEWVIDQYRVRTDPQSGIIQDPNDDEEPQRLVEHVERVVRVAFETVAVIRSLPELG